MYGATLYAIKQQFEERQKIREAMKGEKEEKEKIELAKQILTVIKNNLENCAQEGKNLITKISYEDEETREKINKCFNKLIELGWEEGISIYMSYDKLKPEYYATIENIFFDYDMYRFISNNRKQFLDANEKNYIDLEKKYFEQLSEGTDISTLLCSIEQVDSIDSIEKIDEKNQIYTKALANAAYRIGMENDPDLIELGFSIEPTYYDIFGFRIDSNKYENYIQIMHRYYKEKTPKESQSLQQKVKNQKEG